MRPPERLAVCLGGDLGRGISRERTRQQILVIGELGRIAVRRGGSCEHDAAHFRLLRGDEEVQCGCLVAREPHVSLTRGPPAPRWTSSTRWELMLDGQTTAPCTPDS